MKRLTMWGLAAVMALVGFASSPAQAKEPALQPLEGKTALEGPRGYRGYRGGRRGGYWGGGYWRGPRFGYGYGYHRPVRRYYAPPPVIVAPPPVVYYGGSVSCY